MSGQDMFETAIIELLQANFPPARPLVVEERALQSSESIAWARYSDRMASSYEKSIDDWIERKRHVRAKLSVYEGQPLQLETLKAIDNVVADYEHAADAQALMAARMRKKMAKQIKLMFRLDPAMAAVTRSASNRFDQAEQRSIEALLDYVLFLRAFRAAGTERRPIGPKIDKPDLSDLFARALA
jgi:hypothetical protein